jgi:hypothetical protein
MSFYTQIAVDFGWSLAVAGAGLAIGWSMARGAKARPWFWGLALAPMLTPALLVSYAWAHVAQMLGPWPWMLHGFHSGILTLKLAPIAALARHYIPAPLGADADYCHRLLAPRTAWDRTWFLVRAAGTLPWIVFGLLFLLAFPEFELASLWSLKTWPVALFDAHAGGLALSESLRLAMVPTLVQFAVLAGLVFAARRLRPVRITTTFRTRSSRAVLGYVAIAFGVLTFWPLALVTWQAVAGLPSLAHNTIFPQDLAASLTFAMVSAVLVWLPGGVLRRRRVLAWGAIVAGLLGALVVALLTLAVFQLPGLRVLYDTPVPLLTALVIILIPGALLLRRFVDAPRGAEALHLARLAGSRRLVWELDTEPRFAAVALLACWAWFDFTASSILAPTGLTPVFVRLHNLAHYGQTAALSAMLFAAVAAPAAVLALTHGAARLYARRDAR